MFYYKNQTKRSRNELPRFIIGSADNFCKRVNFHWAWKHKKNIISIFEIQWFFDWKKSILKKYFHFKYINDMNLFHHNCRSHILRKIHQGSSIKCFHLEICQAACKRFEQNMPRVGHKAHLLLDFSARHALSALHVLREVLVDNV